MNSCLVFVWLLSGFVWFLFTCFENVLERAALDVPQVPQDDDTEMWTRVLFDLFTPLLYEDRGAYNYICI